MLVLYSKECILAYGRVRQLFLGPNWGRIELPIRAASVRAVY